jgi:hypothetical protein
VKLVGGALVLENQIVHLPELPLGRGALRRLGGIFGVLVPVRLGEASKDVPEPGSYSRLDLLDRAVALRARRACEVPVPDESDPCQGRSPHMVLRRDACRAFRAVTPVLQFLPLPAAVVKSRPSATKASIRAGTRELE